MKNILKKPLLLTALVLVGTTMTSQTGIYFVPRTIQSQLQLMVDDLQNKYLFSDKVEVLRVLKSFGLDCVTYKKDDTDNKLMWNKYFEQKGYSENQDYEFCDEHIIFYEEKNNCLFNALQNNQKVYTTIFNLLKKELTEPKKARYKLYHGRESIRFINDQVFMHLLELYHQKPIDSSSWYTLHWDKVLTYKEAQNTLDNNYIQPTEKERKKMQFFSNLFGSKNGSSALQYTLENRNAGKYDRSSKTIEELFDFFGWKQYYKIAEKEFKKAEELAKFFKYGTLLQYSFTAKALKEFTFASHESGGIKDPIYINQKTTNDTKMVLDTLENHPEQFHKKNKGYEYVMMICDDDKENNKLGSANPFNEDIRVYAYNLGDDANIAQQIKELIKTAFTMIQFAMIQDGVIKQPLVISKL